MTVAATPGHEKPDPVLLVWFQKVLGLARAAADPDRVTDEALGGRVSGLATAFDAMKAKRLPIPKTIAALERFVRARLPVEGGEDHLRVTEHTLRVLTADDEGPVAYYFFDDEAVRAHPDRVGFLLLDDPRLPDVGGIGPAGFRSPVTATPLVPAGTGAGTTFACLLTNSDGPAQPGRVVTFAGVRMPVLASHLRSVAATDVAVDTWPPELRLLAAQIGPGDRSLAPALARCARLAEPGGAESSIIHESERVAVLCARGATGHGFQQWILFDDRWASAQPDLAASILRYAGDWDPFVWRKPKKKSPRESAADTLQRAWARGVGKRTEADAEPYHLSARYIVGSLLRHAQFGLGAVELIDGSKIQVVFQDARRTLVHGRVAT